MSHRSPEERRRRLIEVLQVFLKLGIIGFGGPAAHIGLMHAEVVQRRKWLDDQEFLDLLGATNLIPGPNSTEMAIHLGYRRAGLPGLIAGGLGFIVPAFAIMLAFAWAYTRFGTTPAAEWLLYGIKPVVMAIILQALYLLGAKAVRGVMLAVTGAAAFALYFLGINELALLFGGGLAVMLIKNWRRLHIETLPAFWLAPLGLPGLPTVLAEPVNIVRMFLIFLKIGAVMYGSGYVLLAFLHGDLVTRLGWLTERQLLDAVALGQVTPGPLFTTATFIGYQLGGLPGALLATLGIFLPSFVFVILSSPLIPRLRQSTWAGALLDGINVAALGLMASVTVKLAADAIVDLPTALLGLIGVVLLLRFKVNPTWLVVGGALAGGLRALIGG